MPELLWVVGALLLIFSFSAGSLWGWDRLLATGNDLMLGAALVAIPLELIYYVLLGLTLYTAGTVPRGWYWRPFAHHHLLSARQRLLVLPFFYSSALGFLAIVIGIVLALFSIVFLAGQLI